MQIFCGRVQGTGVDCMISQPGLVKTELNGRKLDHRKLSAIGVDLATKVYGQDASQAANCLIRPATDPTVDGARFCLCLRTLLLIPPIPICPDHARRHFKWDRACPIWHAAL